MPTPDQFEDVRRFLLQHNSPPVTSMTQAVDLLCQLGIEGCDLLDRVRRGEDVATDEIAGFRRRRAYVAVHLAELDAKYEAMARTEVEAWQQAERHHTDEVLRLARR